MRHIYSIFLFCCIFLMFSTSAGAQKKMDYDQVSLTVVDEAGNPIQDALVTGTKSRKTDDAGQCVMTEPDDAVLVIKKEGYKPAMVLVSSISGEVVLLKTNYSQGFDVVDYGYVQKTKREASSPFSTVKPGERLDYDFNQSVGAHLDVLTGITSGTNIRGIGGAMYVIDGIPNRDISLLDATEIEQITVLKDANATAMYGSQARNGVIVVTTKRGKIQKDKINVSARYGIQSPISYPKYLGSAEYMSLYNEARANDGLDPLYEQAVIDSTLKGNKPYQYPDVDFYSDDYLRALNHRAGVTAEFIGGNKDVQYYVNMDYDYNGTLEKINPDANKGRHAYKLRGNLDFPVNSWIKSNVDVMASLGTRKTTHSNLLNSSANFRPNLYAPLLPVDLVSDDEDVQNFLNTVKTYDGYILGGSNAYKGTIPFGDIYAKGYRQEISRNTMLNTSVDFDLNRITEGLSAKAYVSMDYFDRYNQTINNEFNYYEPTWEGDSIVALTALGEPDKKDQTQNVGTTGFLLRSGLSAQINYKRTFADKHDINAALIGYAGTEKYKDTKQTDKFNHIGFSLDYGFNNKLFANVSGAYVSSVKLPEGNRGKLSPSFGLSYVLLEGAGAVDFLKVRGSWGNIKTDIGINDYFLYQEIYDVENSGGFTWNDGDKSTKRTQIKNGRNDYLSYIEKEDINLGLVASLFQSLFLDFNVFRTDISGFVSRNSTVYPSFYNTFIPYGNSELNRYRGIDLGVNYKKTFGDLTLNLGGTFVYSDTEVIEVNQAPQEYDYLEIKGQKLGRLRGLTADGFYGVEDFDAEGSLLAGMAQPSYGTVQPGDIKYLDINNDGVVNNNDQKTIGHTSFPYSYGLNVLIKYKNVSLFMLGKGQHGAEAMLNGRYYWVNGNDKYSEVVRDRWTPETALTATYPRLTTGSGNNNFRNSTYWMYDKSYFDIRRVQLTYEMSDSFCDKIGFNNISVNVAGENLFKFGPEKDILELNTSGMPQFRNVTFGVRLSL